MAGEGGNRAWWRFRQSVNVANGNLHLQLGPKSCVTCGGSGGGSAYPRPQATNLEGPLVIYNGLGTPDIDMGPKWMHPLMASMTVDGSGNVTLIDADGTQRAFTKDAMEVPATYTAPIEDGVLTDDGTDYILTRCNGDKWIFGMSGAGAYALKVRRIESRTTHTITVTRDTNGRIEKLTDGQGREIFFFYITYGSPSKTRLCEIREPAPGDVGFVSTFFAYDSSGRLAAITNAIGETTRFEYDTSNRIIKAIDGHGEVTEYTYDTSSRVTNVKDPANNSTAFVYTSTTTTVTNRESEATEYTIDSNKRVTKIKDALNNEAEFSYNSTTWELDYELDAKIPVTGTPWTRHKIVYTFGTTTATQHDLLKKEVKKLTDTASETLLAKEEWTYNGFHEWLTYKDELDSVITNTYKEDGSGNSVGLVATVKNGEDETIATNTYDSAANKYRLLTYKNGVNQTWTLAYNQNTANSYGTPDRITTPAGKITNFKIDVRGRKYEVKDPSGNAETLVYDDLDRLIKTIHPGGTSTQSVFGCCHLVATVDENGQGLTTDYDQLGRIVKITDANGEETSYTHDKEGRQLTETDPRGEVTTLTYDDIGRVLQIDYPGGWQEIFTYWEPGMVKTKKTKKSTSETLVNYEYDDLYQPKKVDYPSGTDIEFVMKANGLREKMKDASGEKRYYYDKANRILKVEQGPQGFTVGTNHHYVLEYVWNAASQLTEMKLTARNNVTLTTTNTYTADGYLDVVTDNDGAQTKHEYLDDGRIKKITLKNDTSNKKSTREYFYQDTNDSHAYVTGMNKHLRKTLDKKQGGTVICSASYELDAAGMRLSMLDKDGKYIKYGYDPLNQLKSENKWSAKTPGTRDYQFLYAFDPNGNRLKQFKNGVETSAVYGDNNEMTSLAGSSLTFDHFGNTKTYATVETMNYDFERNMTSRAGMIDDDVDTHEYDGDGRRMRSKLHQAADWTHFVHDELTENIICEFQIPSGSNPTYKAIYTWGIGLISSTHISTKRWFHFDGLGNTLALTDFDENITDTYAYSGFGIIEASSGTSTNPFRFVGQWGYYDDGARGRMFGLVQIERAYYKPLWGRLLTRHSSIDNSYLVDIGAAAQRLPGPQIPSVCVCPFRGGYGSLTIDCSCVGLLRLWVIPEDNTRPAFTPAQCGFEYGADGFVVDDKVYKIGGSTCVTIVCEKSTRFRNRFYWKWRACVNIFGIPLGGGFWEDVGWGTFANEPKKGAKGRPVIR